jgi:predicted transcriptional regulator
MSTLTVDVDEELREALRLIAESVARGRDVQQELAAHHLDPLLIAQQISDAVSREDDCPDCYRGTVDAGPMEHDTGHVPGRCDAGCGYVA